MNNKVLILAVGVVSMFLIFSTVGVVGAQTETTNAVKPKQISVIADTASTVSDPAQSSGSSRGANPTRLDGIMIQPANACGRALSPIGGLFSTIFCALLPDGSYEWSRANNLLNNGDTVGIGTAPAATKLSVLANSDPAGLTAISGRSETGTGIYGYSDNFTGVRGGSNGASVIGIGVEGLAANGVGVFGSGRTAVMAVATDLSDIALDARGRVKLVDGTEGAGKVLTSDAAGFASWQDINPSGTGDGFWVDAGNNDIRNVNSNRVLIGEALDPARSAAKLYVRDAVPGAPAIFAETTPTTSGVAPAPTIAGYGWGTGVFGQTLSSFGAGVVGSAAVSESGFYAKAVEAVNLDAGFGFYQRGRNAKNYFEGTLGFNSAYFPEATIDLGGGSIKMGYQMLNETFNNSASNAYLECPGNKKVLTGGCNISSTDAQVSLIASHPGSYAGGWYCNWNYGGDEDFAKEVYVICADIR